jgi:hypothetical protein
MACTGSRAGVDEYRADGHGRPLYNYDNVKPCASSWMAREYRYLKRQFTLSMPASITDDWPCWRRTGRQPGYFPACRAHEVARRAGADQQSIR